MGNFADSIDVLLVTANDEYAEHVEAGLPDRGAFSVSRVSNISGALAVFHRERLVDCIISDHDLPETDGVAFLQAVRAQHPDLPFILYTGEGNEAVASRAISAGVTDYLVRERERNDLDELARQIEDAVTYYRSRGDRFELGRRTRDVLNAARDPIAIAREGRFVFVNDSGVSLFAADDRDELDGRSVSSVVAADLDAATPSSQDDDESPGELLELETRVRTLEGTFVPVELVAVPIRWDEAPGVLLTIRDISERTQLESNLRQFRRAVEAAGHAVYITDRDGTIRTVNAAFEDITGYDAEEAIGETPRILTSGTMDEAYYEELWETILDGEVWEEVVTNRRKNGDLYQAHQTIAPLFDDGEIEGFVAIQTDVTDTKELARTHEYYREAIECSTDFIAALDRDERYLFANEAYCAFHGIDKAEIAGTHLSDVLSSEEYDEVTAYNDRVFDGDALSVELEREHPDLGTRQLDTRVYPIETDSGEIRGLVASMRDVTERRELEWEREQFETIVRRLDDPIMIQDLDGKFVLLNEAVTEQAGIPESELLGRDEFAFMDEESAFVIAEKKADVLESEEPVEYEVSPTFERTGEALVFSTRRYPYYDQDGELAGTMAICRDVTELKERERKLRENEAHLKQAQSVADIGSWQMDIEANEIVWSDAVYDIFGASKSMVGKTSSEYLSLVHPDDREHVQESWNCALEGETHDVEYRILSDEKTKWIRERAEVNIDENGQPTSALGIVQDVTDRKEREDQLHQYKRAVEGAYDLIAAVDAEQRYQFANDPYCEYHDIEREDVTDLTLQDVFTEDEYVVAGPHLRRVLDGETVQYRMTRRHPTRGERTLDIRYYPLLDDGMVTGAVAIMRDVTERAEQERQLRVVDRVLRHNVRNTLTAIGMMAEQIRSSGDDDVAETADRIIENANELETTAEKSRVITNVLGQSPDTEPIDLSDVLANVVDAFRQTHPHADLRLEIDAEPTISARVHLYEAFEELVLNAIRHNDSAEPRVAITLDTQEDVAVVAISDDGPGFPDVERNILEEGEETDELYHGSGLGLWLVYWIICRSGGSITVGESDLSGSCVRIELPLAPEPSK